MAIFVVNGGFDDAVLDGFRDHVFRILGMVQHQLDADILQRNTLVCAADSPQSHFDDILPNAEDQGVGLVVLEDPLVLVGEGLEAAEVAESDA